MSQKRSSPKSNNDDETNEDSKCDATCKRARLDSQSQSDTTLQDLPDKLFEAILVRAVALEVKDSKLDRSVWQAEAHLVSSRLMTVSSRWSNILAAESFQRELHRTLKSIAPVNMRLEILHESALSARVYSASTTMHELFMLARTPDSFHWVILVYNRDNVVSEVQCIIPPPERTDYICVAACSVSNCAYAAVRYRRFNHCSIQRISKTSAAGGKFKISPWMLYYRRPISMLSVSPDGTVIVHSEERSTVQSVVSLHGPNGSFQREIKLSPYIGGTYLHRNIIQKSNGNLVLAYVHDANKPANDGINLMEVDIGGMFVRQYASPLSQFSDVSSADTCGRILITETSGRMELLDPEFKPLGLFKVAQDDGESPLVAASHYDSLRNEIVCVRSNVGTLTSGLTILRFTEEL